MFQLYIKQGSSPGPTLDGRQEAQVAPIDSPRERILPEDGANQQLRQLTR